MTKRKAPENPTIIRSKHNASNEWFLTLRASAQDSRLSFEARGILWYLLSKPDDWEVQIADLMRAGKVGRDKVKKTLIELADANYLMRPKKYQNKEGKWEWTPYVLYEAPFTEKSSTEPLTEKPSTDNQTTVHQLTDNQTTVHQLTVNQTTDSQSILHSTENKTQKQNTEDKEQKQKTPLPPLPELHPDFNRIKAAYENNIALVVPMSAKVLNDLLYQYPAEWVLATFDEAVAHNKRSISYCKAILERWQREGRAKPANGNDKPVTSKDYTDGKYSWAINNDPDAGLVGEEGLTA